MLCPKKVVHNSCCLLSFTAREKPHPGRNHGWLCSAQPPASRGAAKLSPAQPAPPAALLVPQQRQAGHDLTPQPLSPEKSAQPRKGSRHLIHRGRGSVVLQQEKISIIASFLTHEAKIKTESWQGTRKASGHLRPAPQRGIPRSTFSCRTPKAKDSSQNSAAEHTGTEKHGNWEAMVKEDKDLQPPLLEHPTPIPSTGAPKPHLVLLLGNLRVEHSRTYSLAGAICPSGFPAQHLASSLQPTQIYYS